MPNWVSAGASTVLVVAGISMGAGAHPTLPTPRNAVLFSFAGADGAYPSDVTADAAGMLYGTTVAGGSSKNCYRNCGTIFRLVPPAADGMPWVHQVLYSFRGLTDGAMPVSRPILDSEGNLYGVAPKGGNAPCGTGKNGCGGAGVVWELSPPVVQGDAWTYQVLHTFTGHDIVRGGGQAGPDVDGFDPVGPLVRHSAGVLYGTTAAGGAAPHYVGIAYALSPPEAEGQGWTETVLHDFRGVDGTGATPLLLTGRQQTLLSLSSVVFQSGPQHE